MKQQRKKHSGAFKAKVALEAVKAERTLNELAGHFEIQPPQQNLWVNSSGSGRRPNV
jgi:transposase-like protein